MEFRSPRERKLFQKTVSDKQTILKDFDNSITKMEQSKKELNWIFTSDEILVSFVLL